MTPRPYTLVAELTHRCPLACPYCSNPLQLVTDELDTGQWSRVLEDAEALGVVQLHLTGGEPLVRRDLELLVAKGRALGMYVNLITSGVPLVRERLEALAAAGLDHVQVSLQSADATRADAIAGRHAHARKLEVLGWIKDLGLPLTINVVLHAANLDEVDALVELAEAYGAHRLELANVQYVSWALANRSALLPDRDAIERAARAAARHKQRLAGSLDVVFVKPDYFGTTPKACMDGWAQRFIVVAPDGTVLPCHAASAITGLRFERVTERSLGDIWATSPALQRFRGDDWMQDPCRTCSHRTVDFGGCRCQAFALTGDAAATDPACELSPDRARLARAHAGPLRTAQDLVRRKARRPPRSKMLR